MTNEKTAIVILGASGDLARRKLIPALSRLHENGKLPPECVVVGSGRTAFTNEEFRNRFPARSDFGSRLFYHQGLEGLSGFIKDLGDFKKVVFFFSLPPSVYGDTARQLSACGFSDRCSIVIEKPFGYNLASAQELNRVLQAHFSESQIFRIDHYLAKEMVQNILVFRFANALFEPVWKVPFIESIQINAYETVGVEDRGAYFDRSGIIRDMVQNHLMQLLCLITMEPPLSLRPADIQHRKNEVLRVTTAVQCRRGQYEGYRSEKGVAAGSNTETFAELQLCIDNLRWSGIPVYLRTGKRAGRKGTEIGVRFKRLPRLLFNADAQLPPNQIVFKIQPAEGIIVEIASKTPGTDSTITATTMNFCYRDAFEGEIPEAYQRLLLDAIKGDRSLFVSAEEAELSWRIFDHVLDKGDIVTYKPGALPESTLGAEWIDFEKYQSVCG